MDKIKVAVVGAGAFARSFIPLFKAHPLVAELTLCDLNPDKLKDAAARFGVAKTSPSLDHLLTTDVDAVAIITQHWLHAPQAIQALKAGKHVYSAVPTGVSLDEITQLVKTVEETNKVYMIGETSYYYPSPIYCRKRHANGDFGRIVYAEAEYYHDWSHGLEDVYKWRAAGITDNWRKIAGDPPMYYPTHSTSMVISTTDAHMTHVACMGYVDQEPGTPWDPSFNKWQNAMSNQTGLFKMSDGSTARINEFRRIGHPGTVRMNMFGTQACFEDNSHGPAWVTKNHDLPPEKLDALLSCVGVSASDVKHASAGGGMEKVTSQDGTHLGAAPIHDLARLPKEFIGLHNGHSGSHHFLVDDFVKACASQKLPPNNVWQAARYAIPGIIAHESAKLGGQLLPIPDLGTPAKHWKHL